MSSMLGMTSVIHGGDKLGRLSHIKGIIEQAKKEYSSISVDAIEVEKNSIGIAEIRDLIEKSTYTSLSARHRLFIIYDAQKLTDQAQNALLKLYEEQHKHSTYVLEVDSHQSLLPTILSRAVLIDVSAGVLDTQLDQFIVENEFPKGVEFRSLLLPELFKLCEEYAKDRKISQNFLIYMSLLVRDSARTSSKARRTQYLLLSEFLLQSIERIRETNVNARLLLENCVLGWWNLTK